MYSANPAVISAVAALGGSSVGALAPILSNFILQRSATQRDLLTSQISQRETLYSDFINEASRLYGKSLTNTLEDIDEVVALFAIVSRIRLLATEPVLQAAETLIKRIVMHYGEPNLTVEEMRTAALTSGADPLESFSFACRKELRDILRRGKLSATLRT
ncbi:hypothetical protein ACPOL_4198 [Acidisarcina polymorpha]|uniref:Uncharacterized protein n=1 Tax=Acidisarcina polymorpha TaxID=2211140 RepID=A0A2Z5G477_9BACT|nr:hypothetical protein [Acidisarcina polymorpha]AXC13475.1 hypothetical protein ACPOL_4198 [Acidisarcina polymorpha]